MSAAPARALAITQRHDLPELLARILAGRNVEIDAVEAFLDPTIRSSMPDPNVLAGMTEAPARIADAVMRGETRRDFRRLRRRRRHLGRAAWRAICANAGIEPLIHIPDRLFEGYGPNVEAVRALAERGATLLVTVDCGTTSIEPLTEAQAARHGCRRHRPPSGRRGAAAGGGGRQSEPPRRSLRARSSGRGRARLHDGGGGQPRAAPPRVLDCGPAASRICCRCSTMSRSAPLPTSCR